MKNWFRKPAANPLSKAEQVLKGWGIAYKKQPDGSLLVPGNLDISGKGMTQFPDLSSVAVCGDLRCSDNQLTSLKGVPQSVGGSFYCCSNQLTSLEGAPQSVGGGFLCYNNQLTSLEGAPQSITGDFYCTDNQLTSLEGSPQSIGGGLYCSNNRLVCLEGAPKNLSIISSDFGYFNSWKDVPEELRLSQATMASQEQEREKAFSEGATVLQAPMTVSSPLRLKI